jgi:putative NADPH-quinone reductase
MMRRDVIRIALIQGHPDSTQKHFCHVIAEAYKEGAAAAGHELREINVTTLNFPLLRSRAAWEREPPALAITEAQATIAWASHLVIIYPLWLGGMPALLKAFLEQVFRPGFAISASDEGKSWSPKLSGRSARVIVTMGMPAWLYRWYFGAHGLKSLEQGILAIVGVKPNRHTLIGFVEGMSDAARNRGLVRVRALGRQGR